MNIQKYLAFVKTVEYGSFTKAAQILNYSQSGISRMIADLENEWNVTLLVRNKNGVELTSDGIKLLPFARNVCNEYGKLKSEIDDINGVKSGIVRIGTFSSVAVHKLPEIIKKFNVDYPNITFELLLGDYSEIEKWISDGRVDFGILRLPTRADFQTVFLFRDYFSAVIPKESRYAAEEKFPSSAFGEEPFILLEKDDNTEVSALLKNNGITPDTRVITWDDYSIMSMVEKNIGISVLPNLVLKRTDYEIEIKELDFPAYREIGVALKDKKSAPAAVRKFLNYLCERQL